MIIEGDRFSQDDNLADVVIVGAGPSGITSALKLESYGFRVVLIESGKTSFCPDAQKLGDAASFDEKRHAPMSICTRRQLGGATTIWGGRCVPYDPIDFEPRDYIPGSIWPFGYNEILPYYDDACKYFECGRPIFKTYDLPEIQQKTIVPGLEDGEIRSSDLERWSLPTNFGRLYRKTLQNSSRITVVLGMACSRVLFTGDGTGVKCIVTHTLGGAKKEIRGNHYILACGAIETTRILMESQQQAPAGCGLHSDFLGRFYMGHLTGEISKVHFTTDPSKTIYGYLRDRDRVYLRPRFTVTREAQLKYKLTNIVAWLVNPAIADSNHGNGVLSFAYLALASPLGKYFASEAIRKAHIIGANPGGISGHVWNMIRDLRRTAVFIPSFGIRRFLLHRRAPGFFQPSTENVYPLQYHAEHVPNYDSRVTLSNQTDSNGMRRLDIDLRFSDQDVEPIVRFHELLDQHLKSQKIGRLEYLSNDLRQSIWDQAADGFHQAGTTRMSDDRSEGVVDRDCRVYGIDNLYLASSSVFPTSSQANTTFMIVVLALRLAKHLKSLESDKPKVEVEVQTTSN